MAMSSRAFQPQSYEDWLSELKFQNEFANIIKVANQISKMATDKKRAQVDVALVISDKYKVDLQRASNAMVQRVIEQDYNKIAEALFKCKIAALVKYAEQNEPHLARHTRVGETSVRKEKNEIKKPLGFLQSEASVDEEGRIRPPLGFIKKPQAKVDEKGRTNPSLGFLSGD